MATTGLAAVTSKFHEPLSIQEMVFPDPDPNEVLVKINATGVCHTDLHAVDGDWPVKPSLPLIPGHEGVGVVVKAGRNVREVKEGDRVGLPWIRSACGECEWCLAGWETLCPKALYGGYSAHGSFAQYVLAPGAFAAPVPRELTDVDAAPVLCAGVTTWKALKETEAKPGEWVAISGVGGLGQLAVQYAGVMGLHVIAIDIDPQKLLMAKDMGAEIILNPREHNVVETVRSQTGGAHGVVVTAVSLTAFRQAIDITRRKGTCVLVGLPPGEFPVPLFDVVLKRLTIRGSLVGTRLDLEEALAVSADKRVLSHLEIQPFGAVNEALDRLRMGQVEGRVVLNVG